MPRLCRYFRTLRKIIPYPVLFLYLCLQTTSHAQQTATADQIIQAAINALPATGGIVDETALSGPQPLGGPILINKPVRLILNGQFTYSGAAIVNGLFQFLPGSDGSDVECLTPSSRPSGSGGIPTSWSCYVSVTPSGQGMPIFGISHSSTNSAVGPVQLRNFGILASSAVSDIVQANESAGGSLLVDSLSVTAPTFGAGATGMFVHFTSNGPSTLTVTNNQIYFVTAGVNIDSTGQATVQIINNQFVGASQSYVSIGASLPSGQYNAVIQTNNFQDSALASGTKAVDLEAGSCLFENNHFENDNSNALANGGGIVDFFSSTGTQANILGNTFSAGTFAASYSPSVGIDTLGSAYIVGNFIGAYQIAPWLGAVNSLQFLGNSVASNGSSPLLLASSASGAPQNMIGGSLTVTGDLASSSTIQTGTASFATLSSVLTVNGQYTYCSDCKAAGEGSLCASGGNGSVAIMVNDIIECF